MIVSENRLSIVISYSPELFIKLAVTERETLTLREVNQLNPRQERLEHYNT